MKKKAFTLAEILVTLGIIGVVAALTLPTLMSDTATKQIGPKLAKAASMFEQANEALLNDKASDSLIDAGVTSSNSAYCSALEDSMKGACNGSTFYSADGMTYTVSFSTGETQASTAKPHKHYIGLLTVDINGSAEPNADATDKFYFGLFEDGSLRAKGSQGWNGTSNAPLWSDNKCNRDKTPDDPSFCAGSIFDNNFQVLYK